MKSRKSGHPRQTAGKPAPQRAPVLPPLWGGPLRCPASITQEELRRYHQLKAEERRVQAELAARRTDLIARLAEEVPIEPGPYQAHANVYYQQRLTSSALREILGEAEVEDLRERVPPTRCVDLRVVLSE